MNPFSTGREIGGNIDTDVELGGSMNRTFMGSSPERL
jgi:hypothetical protein